MSYATRKSAIAAARKLHGSDYAKSVFVSMMDDVWDILPLAPETAPEPEVVEPEIEEPETAAPAPILSGLIAGMLDPQSQPAAPVPAAPAAPVKGRSFSVEKDRPVQNGVKRPSAGGLCRAVWDFCWAFGSIPTVAQVKEHGAKVGWNVANCTIEYYCWRKYNGISGRVQAAPKPVAAPVTAEQGADALAALGL